ncbi:MAG TPA: M15 family metallopeptidase [Hanamia sp.]|nr:M15 family metallopeptidase [Hanamia sp.]
MNRICKISYWQQISVVIFIFQFTTFNYVHAQSKIPNKYGLIVIKDTKILQKEITLDSNKRMVNLCTIIPELQLDLKYATIHNFMHEKLYPPLHTTFLRKPAADSLKKVVQYLKKQNLAIKIFDAYRPYSVTEKMWEKVRDNRYAANPSKGSGHNRGAAVDLTLIDLKTNKELPMGTGFDNFSDTAHSDFTNLSTDILRNRNILKNAMEKFGFIQLSTEWWHFYIPNSSHYELLDISFLDLIKMDKKKKN